MSNCICKGNWRAIVKEYEPLINRKFKNGFDGKTYIFFGIVHGDDDYYYGMCDEDNKMFLSTCVGSMEQNGLILTD